MLRSDGFVGLWILLMKVVMGQKCLSLEAEKLNYFLASVAPLVLKNYFQNDPDMMTQHFYLQYAYEIRKLYITTEGCKLLVNIRKQ